MEAIAAKGSRNSDVQTRRLAFTIVRCAVLDVATRDALLNTSYQRQT